VLAGDQLGGQLVVVGDVRPQALDISRITELTPDLHPSVEPRERAAERLRTLRGADTSTDIEDPLVIGHSDQAVFASLRHFTYSFTWKIIKMDGFDEKKWFVYLTDHHEGPFSLAEIQAKMAQSQVTTANYVWAEGLTDWKPMHEVAEFGSILNTSQQVAQSSEAAGTVMLTSEPAAITMPAPAAVSPGFVPEISDVEVTGSAIAMPSATQEEKTGEFNTADLSMAQSAVAMPANEPMPPRKPGASPKASKQKSGKSSMAGAGTLLKWGLVVLIPAGIAGAYANGMLDPLLHSPAVKAGLQAASDLAQPYLLKLAEKVPAISPWVSPIPSLEDVAPAEYETLKGAAMQKASDGPKIAIALSNADIFTPAFYVSSNLPDGAVIDFYVEGIPDTLLNQLSFHAKTQATIQKKLGKSGGVRFADGKPLPRGEYIVYATESAQQPDAVKGLLASIPPTTAKTSPVLPFGLKLLVSKPFFLGGLKDATYSSRLKEFHDKLRAKAMTELAEVKQFEATLESQLSQTSNKYNQLRGLSRGGKPSFAARKAWNDFNIQWAKLDDSLKQSFVKWTDSALQSDYYYGTLYSMTKAAGDAVERFHALDTDFFNGKTDAKAFDIQRGSAISVAESSVSALKNKIAQAEAMTPTPNGMPRREGL
jgi:hypothetical protein